MKRNFVFSPKKYLSVGFAMLALIAASAYSQSVPVISTVIPNSGMAGANVIISGTNFSATSASNIVYFGAVQAAVMAATPAGLQVTVPAGATLAPVTVTVNGLVAYSASAFEPTFAGNGAAIDAATFAPGVNLSLSSPIATVIADLDGDGKPDLVVANVYGHSISLLQNIGTNGVLNAASFAAPVTFSVSSNSDNPYGVTAADVDGDGKLDLLVADHNNNQIVVYRNISSGGVLTSNSFAPPVFLNVAADPRRLIVRDLDGDGRPDIISANTASGTITILRNIGVAGSITTNSFAPRVDLPLAGSSEYVAAADLDGDGKPDLAVADTSGFISLYRNHSTPGNLSAGSFDARVDLPAQNGSLTVVVGDLDGDGKPELITSAYLPQTMSVYRNLSTPGSLTTNSFAGPVNYPLAGRGHSIALADLNGDGKPDITEVTELSDALSLFQNIGAGSFTNTSLAARVDYVAGWNEWGVSVGDLDGDGRPDVVLGNVYDNTLTLYKNIIPFGAPPTCTPPPAGLVGWWKGDGSTLDSVGPNNGVNQNVAYSNGVVGQAFAFDPENLTYGTYSGIQIADQPAYALTNSLTIEGWIRPRGDSYIIFWRGDQRPGLDPYYLSMQSSNTIFGICDAGGNSASVVAPMNYFAWTHLAATLDGATGTLSIYTNGVLAVQTNTTIRPFGNLQSDQSPGVGIGNLNDGINNFPFLGDIDEIGLYNRALSAGEIQAIYNAGSLGKCPVTLAPVIVTQPTNQTVSAGGATGFNITANGAPPLTYQWNFNGTNISGATNATLTLTNIQAGQAGNYSVLVTNLYGAVASSNASLMVIVPAVPPTIVSQTPSQIVLLGNPATFTVNVSGSSPLNYFWSRDGALISGATNFSYTLNNAQLMDSGSKFACFVTNAFGSAASTNATLKVIDSVANDLCSGPVVVTSFNYTNLQSTIKATSFGDPVPSCVTDFGNGVWYQFTAPLNGQLTVDTFGSDFDTGLAIYTGACAALTEIACNDDTGGMTSQVTIPTTAGVTYSILVGGYSAHTGNLVFHLNYLMPPVFAVQPANQSVVTGSNASFSATLTGALPMSFQWFFNGAPLADDGRIVGSTTASLSVSNITTADAGSYTLAATNFLGSASSTAAVLNVLVPPVISTQPIGRSVPPGLPTTFSAAATGNPAPGYYQWQLNGTNIPGANSPTYTIAAVSTNHLGLYHLVASNSVGGTVSTDAQLTFGPVAAWGRNLNNECLPPPNLSNVIGVAGTYQNSFAVRADGTIAAWGSSSRTNIPVSATNVVALFTDGSTSFAALRASGTIASWGGMTPPALSNVVSVALGFYAGFALRAEGTLTGWGSLPYSTVPAGLNHVTAIAAGYSHALALRNDGTVVAWGTGPATNVPAGLTNVTAIAAGATHSMALKSNGTVIVWGSGSGTNLPAGLTNIVAISASSYVQTPNLCLAIRSNGKVVAWGDNPYSETNPPAALSNLLSVAIAAAPNHGLALVNDGSPVILHPPIGLTAFMGRDVTFHGDAVGTQPLSYQWLLNGTNLPGATGTSLVISNIQFANAGNYQLFVSNSVSTALSLAAPLTVLSNNTLTILSQQTAAQTNYQGSKVTLAGPTVLGNGPLRYQWFFAPTNQIYAAVPGATNDTLVLDPALAINTGNYYVAVSNQFAGVTNSPAFVRVLFAKAWGYLATDPPGSLNVTNATAIAVGNAGQGSSLGHYLVLKSDGKISSWAAATSGFGETNFTALSNSIVTAIAAGYQDSLALKSDGTVFAVGYNVYAEANVPLGLNGVTAIACGDYHDLALKSDGTVTGWGQNTYLQTTNAAATNVVAIAASGQNSMVLRADGSVFAWGANQFSIPFNLTNIIAIACGSQHFLALRANGTVVGWGNNSFGQTTIATNLTNIVAIAAAANHSTLLRNDGTVVTLGNYVNGVASNAIPADLTNVIAIADGGDHDLALFGTRAPAFTVQPWNRAIPSSARTNILLAAKCAGVQPMSYQWQLNGTNLPGANSDSLLLTNQPSLQFGLIRLLPGGTYQLIASNAYGIALSKPAKITVVIPLGDALDATNLNWLTSGSAPWFGQTNYVHPVVTTVNSSAARSGGIGALQETILQTTFTTNVAGSVSFWWKVSSEQFFDTLEFCINGTVQATISGEVDWTPASFPLAAGTNVLMWRYSKDASFDSGLDSGFVDQFAFTAAPVIIRQPAGVVANLGNTVSLSVTATGTAPMRYQWFHNGSPMNGEISSTYTKLNAARAQDGTYSVTVTNSGGMVVSSNATVLVKVPQLLGASALLPDGSLQFNSTDANGGLLSPSDLANFEAQASTNLVDWVTLPNALSLTNGMLQLQDSGQSNYNARYYRILEH